MTITGRDVFKVVYFLCLLFHVFYWGIQIFQHGIVDVTELIVSLTTISLMTVIFLLIQKESKDGKK